LHFLLHLHFSFLCVNWNKHSWIFFFVLKVAFTIISLYNDKKNYWISSSFVSHLDILFENIETNVYFYYYHSVTHPIKYYYHLFFYHHFLDYHCYHYHHFCHIHFLFNFVFTYALSAVQRVTGHPKSLECGRKTRWEYLNPFPSISFFQFDPIFQILFI
jgi:hypothetical protein